MIDKEFIPTKIDVGDDFFVDEHGVHFKVRNRAGEETSTTLQVCSPMKILAQTKNEHGREHGKLIAFLDHGIVKQVHVKSAELSGSVKTLVGEGLELRSKDSASKLVSFLHALRSPNWLVSTMQTGWMMNSFILPGQSFGPDNAIFAGDVRSHNFSSSGTL
jgi:putative DNA primase/helicase